MHVKLKIHEIMIRELQKHQSTFMSNSHAPTIKKRYSITIDIFACCCSQTSLDNERV